MNKKALSFWTALIFVAILTFLGIFMLPSSAEKAWMFGLSTQRAVLAFFPFTCIVFCIIIVALSVFAPDRYRRMMAYFRQNTLKSAMLTGGLCFWAALFLIVFLLYYQLFIAPNTTELTVKLGIQFTSFCAYL
ncbi:MAG TPA: hypothetical protein VKF38_15185, partial [Anaerolineaceae bacterium]|nr:hypothetical protein [Anaerolineaceae bacterium]